MKPANPPDASVERARDAVAKAIYAKRPYYLAATQSVVGQASLARRLDWDDAPAFYLSDCLEIAEVARAAHVTTLTAQLEAERARALRWKWSIYREVVRFHREDHDALCLSLLNVGNRAEDLTTRLAAVEAERDALREALEPVAAEADKWRYFEDDLDIMVAAVKAFTASTIQYRGLTVGQLRKARATLAQPAADGGAT